MPPISSARSNWERIERQNAKLDYLQRLNDIYSRQQLGKN